MSLQDDIFDVRDALKKLPEAKGFDRIVEALNYYEVEYDKAAADLSAIRNGLRVLKKFMKEK